MDLAHQIILVSAGLVFLSIVAGLVSSRVGAPLLLVFLGLGMLAGEDGPGGIDFDDFEAAYLIGATALAVILFDGGLRTSRQTMRLAAWPALTLATLGVVVTTALIGAFAHHALGFTWLEGLLAGAIVASTDAAAVFFLLNLRGTNLVKRVSATLEAESGFNDPVAVFLAVTLVELLAAGLPPPSWAAAGELAGVLALQLAGGAALGWLGGQALLRLVNTLRLAAGLYPVMALSGALLIFAGAQLVGASGFLAVYLAGLLVGTRRHRATQLIERFQDGAAWLCQIVMFLMLGLLVTPSELVGSLGVALAIAAFLILVARPVAVALCLAPFRFTAREQLFVAWVGLRGGVAIFLGILPVLAGLPEAARYFEIAFVVVLSSLLIQGWTLTVTARRLDLALPPPPEPPQRVEIDLPDEVDREMVTYSVQEGSAAADSPVASLGLGDSTSVVAVMRDGAVRRLDELVALYPGDSVVLLADSGDLPALDRLFGRPPAPDRYGRDRAVLGEFEIDGGVAIDRLAEMYSIPVPADGSGRSVGAFMQRHLKRPVVVGDRLRLGTVELIVVDAEDERITRVGLELDPRPLPLMRRDVLAIWSRHLRARLGAGLRRGTGGEEGGGASSS